MPRAWFTADLHVGHRNIIRYCKRPWARDFMNPTREETEQMDRDLVENWNAIVGYDDDVYDLGDLTYCSNEAHAADILGSLKGRHHVIEGNHDAEHHGKEGLTRILNRKYPNLFASYHIGHPEFVIQGQTIVMCHYAMREWHHALRGVWHLFGHTHGYLPSFGKSVDIGVDNVHNVIADPDKKTAPLHAFYRPISFEELKAFMDRQPIGPHAEFENFTPGHPELANLHVLGEPHV